MYKEHCPVIAAAMREDFLAFQRGIMFAVCSIRQATVNVPEQLAVLFDGGEDYEHPLFGFKWQSWDFVLSEACRELWATVRADYDPERLILAFSQIPGLGIVKSAFVAQLMGADIACIDSRNATRLSVNAERLYRSRGEKDKRTRAYRARVRRYVQDWQGQAERLWDEWCRDIAPRYGLEPEEVSALHMAIIPPNYIPF